MGDELIMARLMLLGPMSEVELTIDDEDEQVVAACTWHSGSDGRLAPPGNCSWTKRYSDMRDATECAADHADTGGMR
jgi:hypothetical protein